MIETQTHIIRHFENRDLQLAASLSKQTTSGVIDIVGATNGVFNNNLFYSFETKENIHMRYRLQEQARGRRVHAFFCGGRENNGSIGL